MSEEKLKSYPHWTFTTLVGIGTLAMGFCFVMAGLQDLGQPVEEWIALIVGILMLVGNPICYLIYRKQGIR